MEKTSRITVLNEMSISIDNEDHTLINPLKHIISTYNDKSVEFCGYNIPHPADKKVNLVIQFKDGNNQNIENMLNVLDEGIDNLKKVFNRILEEVEASD